MEPIISNKNVVGLKLLERLRDFKKSGKKFVPVRKACSEIVKPIYRKPRRNSFDMHQQDVTSCSVEVYLPAVGDKHGWGSKADYVNEQFELRKETKGSNLGQKSHCDLTRNAKRSHS